MEWAKPGEKMSKTGTDFDAPGEDILTRALRVDFTRCYALMLFFSFKFSYLRNLKIFY
jgi:hypothetical protein